MQLSWSPLRVNDEHAASLAALTPEQIRYFIIYTEDGRGQHLESTCTLEDAVWKAHGYARLESQKGKSEGQLGLVPGSSRTRP